MDIDKLTKHNSFVTGKTWIRMTHLLLCTGQFGCLRVYQQHIITEEIHILQNSYDRVQVEWNEGAVCNYSLAAYLDGNTLLSQALSKHHL